MKYEKVLSEKPDSRKKGLRAIITSAIIDDDGEIVGINIEYSTLHTNGWANFVPGSCELGYWEHTYITLHEGRFNAYRCSCCGKTFLSGLDTDENKINVTEKFRWCPCCGTRMQEASE